MVKKDQCLLVLRHVSFTNSIQKTDRMEQ